MYAQEEQEHADRIAARIRQLGGKPEMDPAVVAQTSHTEYKEGTSLVDMLREDLVAERIAVATYREIITYFGQDDPTSRTMIEAILAQEEEHAAELADLLFAVEPDTDSHTRRLYFADEIPEHSDAGQEVHA